MTNDSIKEFLAYFESADLYSKKSHPLVHELLALVRIYRESNQFIKQACLCNEMTPGFDYGENHKRLGKAGIGQRWVPPRDKICITEQKALEIVK